MKIMNKAIAVLLALVLISGTFVCFAADGEKQYHKYEKVMLLGDSQNSGFSDYRDIFSEYTRVDDSFAAYVADDLGAELLPYACPGFRTIELRYLLDDTYRPDDKYLFEAVPRTSMEEFVRRAPEVRNGIAESDMIMIGIGGNDWGAYFGWVAEDIQEENRLPEEYKAALREYLAQATLEDDIIAKMVELADTFNALDELLAVIPGAIEYAFTNLKTNWNWIVEYIYENNPDVTLMVIGMFPTYYSTEEDAPDVVATPNAAEKMVEDSIIESGNKHLIEGQSKYGYIYVDTYGTTVETAHPTIAGQRFIADRILEELPCANFPYTADVALRNPNYKAIEYVVMNGIMEGTSDTTFSPDETLTKDVLSKALNKITGDYKITDKTGKVSKLDLAFNLFKAADKNGIMNFFNAVKFSFNVILTGDNNISRGEAAGILQSYSKTFA